MLNRKELKEISSIHGNGSYFVSFYLNVNPITNARGEYVIQLKNMIKDISDRSDKKVLKMIKDDLEKIESFVNGNKRELKKGLAILSSSEKTFWKAYQLSVPVKSEIIVDKTPFIKPLLDIMDNYQRYAVLLVDKETARIFLLHLGEITEYGDIHTPDVPGKHSKGGWFALSQNHYARHVDYHVGLHLKDVVRKLESFLKDEKIERVVLGGPYEAVVMTKDLLLKTITDKIIGTFRAGMFENNADILKKIEPVISEFEKKKEKMTVSELLTMASKRENAVVGIDNVLNALQEGRIMRLAFVKDFRDSGYACRNCRYLTKQKVIPCPYCRSEMEEVNYLVDLAAQRAVENGALVHVISESQELLNAGGIGAFLRF